ncbi:MAG: acyl--CoA ligase, partial [Desulfobulbaceae bacterium]|nr:acyl--CoA ligase [Desulfobulbaceae bacterium]
MLIHDFLIKSASRFPGKEAIIHAGKRYTYSDILDASSAISNWLLSRNLKPGFRAAILTDDPFEYVTSYFAIITVNGIVVGLNTQTSERTLKTALNDCKASLIFINIKFKRYLDKIAPSIPSVKWAVVGGFKAEFSRINGLELVDREDILTTGHKYDSGEFARFSSTDIAQIIYTSGTTGEPKGVMLSHLNLVANTNSIVEYLGLTEDDRVMAVLPFFYSYGNSILLTHIAVGGSLVVNQSFMYPNVILDEMVNEKVTGFSGVPSTYAILLNRSAIKNYRLPSLRYITQAGAAMAPKLAQRLKEIFPDVDIYIMYGQTEA